MDMRCGTWSITSLYRAGSQATVAREIADCKLDLVGIQVRWDRGGTELADDYKLFCGSGNENLELGIGFFVHITIIAAVKRVEFVSYRM
jgi:hypothetical protein